MSLHWDVWDPEMSGDTGSLPCGAMAEEIMAVVKGGCEQCAAAH
jgi:hypothetical protein